MGHNFIHRSQDEIDKSNLLADRVVTTLLATGIPASHKNRLDHSLVGAVIEIDSGDDDSGGVYVMWRPSQEMIAAAQRASLAGHYTSPEVVFSGAISDAMSTAIITILTASGFVATEANDLRPFDVHVIS